MKKILLLIGLAAASVNLRAETNAMLVVSSGTNIISVTPVPLTNAVAAAQAADRKADLSIIKSEILSATPAQLVAVGEVFNLAVNTNAPACRAELRLTLTHLGEVMSPEQRTRVIEILRH